MYNFSSIIRILLLHTAIILLFNPTFVKTQEVDDQRDNLAHETIDVTALAVGHVNVIACSFVIYSAYVKWRTSCLSISSRVPLYLSISDLFQYPLFMPNFYYSLIYHDKIPEVPCKLIAYLLFFQINVNMILMASIALVTYLRVVKSKTMNLGKYDWKFFTWILVSSFFISTPSIPSLGASKFWCLTSTKPANTLLINAYVVFAMTFLTTCYCYYKTLSTIFNVDQEETSDSADRINRRNRLERQATRKILIYVLIFMKWIPLLAYGVCIMFSFDEVLWVDLSMIIAFNLGGIFNCILYIVNEYTNHNSITYTLEVEGGQGVDNPSSRQLSQSFNQHHQQQTNSSANSITLVMSALSIEESTDVIDLKTFGNNNEELSSGNNGIVINDAGNRDDNNNNNDDNNDNNNDNNDDNDKDDKDKVVKDNGEEDENGRER